MSHALRKAVRTFAQLVVSGGLTAAVSAVAHGFSAPQTTLVLAGWQLAVTWAQNALEAAGKVPTLLPSPAVPGAPAPMLARTPAGVALPQGK